jgi:hypothetical protein
MKRKKEIAPITERVKTFEDAVEVLGKNHIYVRQYVNTVDELRAMELDDESKDITAYLKLRIITEALNEGWKPKFTEGEWRWSPYFQIFSNEEAKRLSDDEQKKLLHFYAKGDAYFGLSSTFADGTTSYSFTGGGSRLCFKTSELSVYAGRQFVDIYFDYLIK